MSKELSPLEALKELYHEREYTYAESVNHKSKEWANDIKHYDNIGDCLSIIETALKDYEQIEYHNLKVRDFDKKIKALESIKECCEFDFIKKEETNKPIRYEIHIRRKGGDNIFFPCVAIYPKNQEEYELLKEVLK